MSLAHSNHYNRMATDLAPQIISRLLSEIRDLVRNPVEGITYVESDDNSLSEIHAIISGPEETPFVGGKFRMKLVLSGEYPTVPPKGFFLTRIYHPNVASTGDICVNTLKKDWTPDVTMKHILQVIRCLLIVPFPESSLNDEAGKLFMDSYDEFARRARIMTEVHAMNSIDENIEDVVASSSGSTSGSGSDSSSSGSNSSSKDTHTHSPMIVVSEEAENKRKKIKEAKKKSLKRL